DGEDAEDHSRGEKSDGCPREQGWSLFEFFRIDASADETGDEITHGRREEPDSHHLADVTAWRELCHRRESDRAQAKLAEGLEQITYDQPDRRDLDRPVRCNDTACLE